MELNQETNKKIEELQALENQMQTILAQKQVAQAEMNEVSNAIDELKNSDDEVYKVISGIMIKSTKEKLTKALEITVSELDLLLKNESSLGLIQKINLPLIRLYCETKFDNQNNK